MPLSLSHKIERFSQTITRWTGSASAFALAAGVIFLWALTGPIFGFSDTWQLIINTSTTIVTFLMVFLIQRAQNKDALAIQLKLNEIVAALDGASNRLIDIEDLSEQELQTLHEHFKILVQRARSDRDICQSHSVEEAERRHHAKHNIANKKRF
jgi:low affinity Fe/Cu permease